MSDKITACTQVKDAENAVIQYDVAYTVENNGSVNQFCVVVLAAELTDPADTNEVQTKANVKAKAIKDAWISSLPPESSTPVEGLVGDVTLPS